MGIEISQSLRLLGAIVSGWRPDEALSVSPAFARYILEKRDIVVFDTVVRCTAATVARSASPASCDG